MENTVAIIEDRSVNARWRSGSQPLMPFQVKKDQPENVYNLYPYHSIGSGRIFNGYDSLARWIMSHKVVVIDGYIGVFWQRTEQYLNNEFEKHGIRVHWVRSENHLKESSVIQEMLTPFAGTPNSVWGTKCTLELTDLYHVSQIQPEDGYDITIIIGIGASLLNADAPVVYLDLPKNELQLRMRSSSVINLGTSVPGSPAEMYKRFYFIDWVLLNKHKKAITDRITVAGDAQWPDTINWCFSHNLFDGLQSLAHSVFRVRPWFEPGAWGGHWMKDRIPGLSQEEINYAWSFELIVPENGIVFESDGFLLELSFDFLMFRERNAVLGRHADRFKDEFPIRFDFLDTWKGSNLSIQCHPSLAYIQKEFGESITQDETYYILDCQEDAQVYLGFQENIDPGAFEAALKLSRDEKIPVPVEQYVQSHPAARHDLFLIPNGTVHSAGAGNLVLEISATPYIFTFKMYDWLRLGLDGEPRAINIEHAFKNLNFNRKGAAVQTELISRPVLLQSGSDWKVIHLPTHAEHFYDVHRLEFDSELFVETNGSCHVLMLVEGGSIRIINENGLTSNFNFAETFVVPASAKKYRIVNTGNVKAKVIKAFLK